MIDISRAPKYSSPFEVSVIEERGTSSTLPNTHFKIFKTSAFYLGVRLLCTHPLMPFNLEQYSLHSGHVHISHLG